MSHQTILKTDVSGSKYNYSINQERQLMLLYSDNYEPDNYEGDQDLNEYEDDWGTVESELFGDC